jgi:hypothetical protein
MAAREYRPTGLFVNGALWLSTRHDRRDSPPPKPRAVRTSRSLLGIPPATGGTDQNRGGPMPQPPTLTGQDIGEAEGAVRALLDQILADTGTTSNQYIALRVLAVRGPDHPDTARSLSSLASVLRAQGDLDGPATLHERALAIREQRLGPDHPDTQRSRRDLAAMAASLENRR